VTAGSPGGDGQDVRLVLCHSADEAGAWAHERLSARLPGPVELVTAEELGRATGWEHRLDASGVVARVELEDGRRIDAARVRGTLNRLEWIWFDRVSEAVPGDRGYAGQELHALVTSWLAALPGPVLNAASPQGLAGALRRRSEWMALAARAGLDTRPLRLASGGEAVEEEAAAPGSGDRVVVVGESVLGPPDAPDAVVDGCTELARASGCALLAVDFDRDDRRGWLFRAAEPTFDLRAGGEPLVEALAAALLTGAERNRGPALRHTV
jgi:hypothetical protein